MSLTAIKDQIQVILAGVPGTGIIHPYERFSNDWNKYLAIFQDANRKINGIMFTREKFTSRFATAAEVERAHVFVIRRFSGLRDAAGSGILFDEINELILQAFEAEENETLGGACLTICPDWGPMAGAVGAQMDISEPRMFGNVLCHYAEFRLCAVEQTQR